MKKVGMGILVLLGLIIIGASVIAIREMVLLSQETVYNLPKQYNDYDLESILTVIPNLKVTYSEEHDVYIGYLTKDNSNEIVILSRPGSKEIESLIYYTNDICTSNAPLNTNLFRKAHVYTMKLQISQHTPKALISQLKTYGLTLSNTKSNTLI